MKFHSMVLVRIPILLSFCLVGSMAATAQTGTLRFGSSAYSISESGGAARITVTRSGGSTGTLSVDFATVDSGGGTATSELDYYPTNGTLTFNPGVVSMSFFIPVIDDEEHEDNETIVVEIQGEAVAGGIAGTTVTLKDNDACSYAVGTNKVVLGASGGLSEPIAVTAVEGCNWTADITTSTASWLAIFSGQSGEGSDSVVLSYDRNDGRSSRTAKIQIGNKVIAVTQLPEPAPDEATPTVAINAPRQNSRHTNDSIVVTGTARDNIGVTLVEARLENDAYTSDYIPAIGTTKWSVALAGLVPGTNIIRVRARDAVNPPTEAVRTVVYVDMSALTVLINGAGKVTPLRDGALLDVGASYTVRAITDRSHEFTGWTGFIASQANPLTFTMQPDFVLQANFRIIPFIAVAGTYEGLCYDPEANRHDSAGFLTVRSTDQGAYSGRLALGGARYSFSGKFTRDGSATNTLTRTGNTPLTVTISIDLTGGSDAIQGTISDGSWTAAATCDRLVFNTKTNPAPYVGKYTVVLPGGDGDPASEPAGFSYGTVSVNGSGRVRLAFDLADGTKFSQGATISKAGYWPLYVPLYSGQGSLLSWVVFAESSEASFTGEVNWVKPSNASSRFYPNGFAVRHELSGSSYFAPTSPKDPVLEFTVGRAQFSAGNLSNDFFNDILLAANKVKNLGTNRLSFSISRSSGLFSGTVSAPDGSQQIPFKGAVHQKQNLGWGYFLGTNQSGRVRFSQ